jgi:uncharacterized protein
MDITTIISNNLLSPAILFFGLGVIAGFLKSDLSIPESISRSLTIYLMLAIGFKGGVAINNTPTFDSEVIATIITALAIGFLLPFLSYKLLRLTTNIDSATAAATAAQYGSVSIVTFVATVFFLKTNDTSYSGYIIAVLALMEAPAIFSGLIIARYANSTLSHRKPPTSKLLHETLTNGALVLLIGSFIIGAITGTSGMAIVEPFLVTPFQGLLCLFMLDMGLLVAHTPAQRRVFNIPLLLFGIYMPLIGATLGLLASFAIGLDIGTGTLFTTMCASASYIAVPAAMRVALPEASASIYLPMALAITFPFNIIIGVPIYYMLAHILLAAP